MSIRPTLAIVSIAPASLVLAALAQPVAAQPTAGRPITVSMTGAAERPGPGDPDGTGTAEFRINVGQNQVCYKLTVGNLDTVTAAHIHRAPATDAGPVVVGLMAPTGGTSSGCATVVRELAQEIIRTPEGFYVNVHTSAFPAGAVRGQLSRTP